MREDLCKKLENDFPGFFRIMYGNFDCGDGWFDLIYNLCRDIKSTNPEEDFVVEQIKEKFGGLRFYVGVTTNEVHDLISKAEDESYKICETCGSRENVETKGGWLVTLCNKCRP